MINMHKIGSSIFVTIHQTLSSVLAPHVCVRCGSASSYILCPSCLYVYMHPNYEIQRCKNCGKQLISEQSLCINCREEPLLIHTDSVYPIHSYRSWKKELLFKWKIEGDRTFSLKAAELCHEVLTSKYFNIPLVPVPPRPGKIRNKGWDQINDICCLLNRVYGHRILKLLIRNEKKQQKTLTREERIHQMGLLYGINSKTLIIPEEVVLIDDLMTTGVTVENCASILKKSGVGKVHVVTLFIAD